MNSCEELMKLVRKRQGDIERFTISKILPKVFSKTIFHTKHFREWFKMPMNYVRIMEIPLTLEFLDLKLDDSILDISSPKLLSLYLAVMNYRNLTITDVENYFVDDFKIYSKYFKIFPKLEVCDARKMPYSDNSFDKAFSISVLEHIPYSGDIDVINEVARVLKPKGYFVFTLPAIKEYVEEWLEDKPFYWQSETKGRLTFYQRRYDDKTIQERFGGLGFQIKDVVYIAEYPIKEPGINENGMLLHNIYYLQDISWIKLLRKFTRKGEKIIPLLPYLNHRAWSQKCHYLTRNGKDQNIRQVIVKLHLANK